MLGCIIDKGEINMETFCAGILALLGIILLLAEVKIRTGKFHYDTEKEK